MEPGELDMPEALAALERFVVENDDLLALEERIGKFNIFYALRLERAEIRHSNFLAWLLDSAESHGQGSLFLTTILMDLMRQMPHEKRPLSAVELDGVELQGVEIRREWCNIDLLIRCDEPRFVIAIENKIDASQYNPFNKYEKDVRGTFPDHHAAFVLITTEGDTPEDEDWSPYSYADLHRALTRCRKINQNAIGDDVLVFLDHYLNLIGSRFMNDPNIDDLCRRIYLNHRRALDLIFERARSSIIHPLADSIRALVQADNFWRIYPRGGMSVYFIPMLWVETFPPIGDDQNDRSQWFWCEFRFSQSDCKLLVYAGPTSDQTLRSDIIKRLTRDPNEFGFRLPYKKIYPKWTTILNLPLMK